MPIGIKPPQTQKVMDKYLKQQRMKGIGQSPGRNLRQRHLIGRKQTSKKSLNDFDGTHSSEDILTRFYKGLCEHYVYNRHNPNKLFL